jgi:hypothetical protein
LIFPESRAQRGFQNKFLKKKKIYFIYFPGFLEKSQEKLIYWDGAIFNRRFSSRYQKGNAKQKKKVTKKVTRPPPKKFLGFLFREQSSNGFHVRYRNTLPIVPRQSERHQRGRHGQSD